LFKPGLSLEALFHNSDLKEVIGI